MGFIADILGIGGNKGTSFQATGVNQQDVTNAGKNTKDVFDRQNAFVNALQGQNGIGNQSNVFQQQQNLANQLQPMTQGQGPNPALAQLAQTTGQNIASQNALMAGQRGVSANPGLIARQAAQMGGNLNQQAAGQAATLSAQQQLAAIQALQQQQQMLAGLSGQQVGQQQQGIGQAGQLALGNQQNVYGMQQNQNNANAQVQGQTAKNQGGIFGGLLEGLGSVIGLDEGGAVPDGPKSRVGQHFHAMKHGGQVPGHARVKGDSPRNDKVPTMLSPGEIVVPRSHSNNPEKAAAFARAVAMRSNKRK